jgi:hypothetical protein
VSAGMMLDAVMALIGRMETELDALPAGDVIDSDGEETDNESETMRIKVERCWLVYGLLGLATYLGAALILIDWLTRSP